MANIGKSDILLQCPSCNSDITIHSDHAICESCGTQWERKRGVLSFSSINKGYVFPNRLENVSFNRLQHDLVKLCETGTWDEALSVVYESAQSDQEREFIYHYNFENRKTVWQLLTQLNSESKVLEFGCGYGGSSIALAQQSGLVVSMDLTRERVEFLSHRASNEDIGNIVPIWGGDSLPLPFKDDYFDVVSMNGVLEWVVQGHTGNPAVVQKKFLKEMLRILKPNGFLYVGIENRFGLQFLAGRPDPHTQLRFVTILPRFAADLYSFIMRRKRFDEYTYSRGKLRKMLRDTGFSDAKIFSAIGTYNIPYFIADTYDKEAMRLLFTRIIKSRSVIEEILRRIAPLLVKIGLPQRVMPAFLAVAQK